MNTVRPGTLVRWEALKKILSKQIKTDSLILDVGSFDGTIMYKLKKNLNIKVFLVDLDYDGLLVAKDKKIDVICASAIKIPVKDERFDFITCIDLIEHIDEDYKLVKELARVLKKGGRLILTTPIETGVTFPFLTKERISEINTEFGHVRKGYTLKGLKQLLQENNFVVLGNNTFFNLFSRFAYWLVNYSNLQLRGKTFFFNLIIKLEPYVKFGAEEHIIIAEKS